MRELAHPETHRTVDVRAGILGSLAIVAVMVGACLVRNELERLSGVRLVSFWSVGCDVALGALLIAGWVWATCRTPAIRVGR